MTLYVAMSEGRRKIAEAAARAASPAVVFYVMPVLMLLLVLGTVSQRFIGLYDAQHMFFSSFFFRAGLIPLPGGITVLAVITASLCLKFILRSHWRREKAGINIAHLGVLVLLAGGLLAAATGQEGFSVIPEGGVTHSVSDYHKRELVLLRDGQVTGRIPFAALRQGGALPVGAARLTVTGLCDNCNITRRAPDPAAKGMAQFMELGPKRRESLDENNLYGMTVKLAGADAGQDGTYILFEGMPKPLAVKSGGAEFELMLGRAQRELPFSLRLHGFSKKTYPGTDKPRAFESDVDVLDGGAAWPARISMNRPLRYKGYTLFQSSYAEQGGKVSTVLAVVRNKGWVYPYIGAALVALGLALHLFMKLKGRVE
jgi:hypothetical protein